MSGLFFPSVLGLATLERRVGSFGCSGQLARKRRVQMDELEGSIASESCSIDQSSKVHNACLPNYSSVIKFAGRLVEVKQSVSLPASELLAS